MQYFRMTVIFTVDADPRNNRMVELVACDREAAENDVREAFGGIETVVVMQREAV